VNDRAPVILVTGSTGYVGGRLAPRLIDQGRRVRCLARDTERLAGRSWAARAEIVRGDLLDPDTLPDALRGVRTAYYLVHGMAGGDDFHERDLAAARNFGAAARAAGVAHIVYLGGLGDPDADLSLHLRSRQHTGEALRASGIPVTEFRAGVVVGSGSLSFEMIRYLTERVPVMVCPRWVNTRTQPIAIRNLLDYLVAAADRPAPLDAIVEIGGEDVLTYGEMLLGYARERGLRRWLLPVPVLTPRLSSLWVHLVTPVPAEIARPLVEGMRNDVVVRDPRARSLFPSIRPMGYAAAVRRALAGLEAGAVETTWADARASTRGGTAPVVLASQEGMILERRTRVVDVPAERVFAAFASLGGRTGWLYWNWAWRLRGAVDRVLGGVGMRRGRRHPLDVRVGDAIDFWRVEAVEPDRMLRLRAEMKVPGRAWLQFEARPEPDGRTTLVQTAFFAPKGLGGPLYWYAAHPVHAFVFDGMIGAIAERARRGTAGRAP